MSGSLLRVAQVSKHFGGFSALSEVTIDIAQGERFGLIGPNGSGKTTLINCISGSLRNESGSIVFDGHDISGLPAYQRTRLGIARSFQIPRPFSSMSVLENLLVQLDLTEVQLDELWTFLEKKTLPELKTRVGPSGSGRRSTPRLASS